MPKEDKEISLNDNLLNIVREMFCFGFKTARELEQYLEIGRSPFNRYKNFLIDNFGEYMDWSKQKNTKAKASYFHADEFETSYNILLDLFTMKKIKAEDLIIFIKVIQELSNSPDKFYPLSEIIKLFNMRWDGKTFGAKIKNMTEYEYLLSMPLDGRSYGYKISENFLNSLDDDTLYRFTAMVDFFRNICHPAVCGHYLLDTVSIINHSRNISYETPFLYKHLHMGQVLEDEKLWTLLSAIYKKQTVSIKNKGKNFINLRPYKIIINETDGRRYVFCIDLYNGRNGGILYRLDKVSDIKTEKNPPPLISEEEANKIYHQLLGRSFTGTCIFKKKIKKGTLIYKKDFYYEIKKYFPYAVPETVDESHDKINIEVNALRELKPWLRRNIGKVKLTETSDETAQEMEQELKEWRAMYGIS